MNPSLHAYPVHIPSSTIENEFSMEKFGLLTHRSMEWHNFDPIEAGSERNSRLSVRPGGPPISEVQSEVSSQWSFTPVSTAATTPNWMQPYSQTPFPAASGDPSPFIDDYWSDNVTGPLDSTFWHEWDGSAELEGDSMLLMGRQTASNVPLANDVHQTVEIPMLDASYQQVTYTSFDGAQNQQEACYGNFDEASEQSLEETPTPKWISSMGSRSAEPTDQFECNQTNRVLGRRSLSSEHSSAVNWARKDRSMHVGAGPRSISMQPGPTSPILSLRLSAHPKRKKGRRAASMSAPVGVPRLPQTTSHKETEKKYRSKLNDQFSTLSNALPLENISASASSEVTPATSKVDTLQLAISHIERLEMQQKELKQESLVLRGQVGLFESLVRYPMR